MGRRDPDGATPGITSVRPGALGPGARIDYAWVVLTTLCLTETVSWGVMYYGFPVFLSAMETELHASRVAVTGAYSLGLAVAAAAAIPVGRWLDARGPRGLMTLGSCLGSLLVAAWSRVEDIRALYLVWIGLGLAMAATLYEPAFVAVVQWFAERRDRALLVLTLCAGLASTIFMPLASTLLVHVGWRRALFVLALIQGGVTIPLHALALRRPPHLEVGHGRPSDDPVAGVTLGVAARAAVFWVLATAFFLGNFSTVTVTVHLIPFLAQYRYPATVVAAAIGWMGAMQLPGRILFVPIASRLGSRAVTAGIFFAQAVGMALIASIARVPSLLPVIVLTGAANGMATLARATTVSDVFGRRHYGTVAGAIALAANGARALAPIGATLLYLGLGTYEGVFWTLAGVLVIAGLAVAITDDGTPATEGG